MLPFPDAKRGKVLSDLGLGFVLLTLAVQGVGFTSGLEGFD